MEESKRILDLELEKMSRWLFPKIENVGEMGLS